MLDLDRLSSGLLALAFDEGRPLSPKSAVLRFLSDPICLTAVLQNQGLIGTFVHVICTQLGFGRLPDGDAIKRSRPNQGWSASGTWWLSTRSPVLIG